MKVQQLPKQCDDKYMRKRNNQDNSYQENATKTIINNTLAYEL